MARKQKVRVGDVVEIPTSKGLAYAQFSHVHARYGALLRVLPGFFEARPAGLADEINRPEAFVTFFPLQAAIDKNVFEVIGNFPVPEFARQFPLFRTGVIDPTNGRVKVWWLWDGEKEWRVNDITSEQRQLPLRGIWNDTLLIERIEQGWPAPRILVQLK